MIKTDEEALICDLAETYQIYDYRQLPTTRVAVFACGLRDDSRIKMKLSGQLVPMDTLLLAGISDKLSMLVWFQTEDGQKGKNRPTSLINLLTNSKEESKKDVVVFDSGEDFVKTRNQLMVGGE
ncbi:hypothetical protein GCM10007971_13010 [Oceanobacillus indicireducens]|uniref:Uncharacterized protein n=1 Tax=Oceanobacillus indicireducens TaxID=1004261 RepID=A0A918D098_9BACI|nr:hypothetical protein GCM10007971_13010 [Oceanobacillus indicireducens]